MSSLNVKIRLGSRGSVLALTQAQIVKKELETLSEKPQIEIVVVKTTGDRLTEIPYSRISQKGIFIKEIEEALLENRIDAAVHSLKDVPTLVTPGLAIAAVLEREDPRDCLISRFGEQLLELPRGAVVGTSSPRRQAQVRFHKKNIRVVDTRGNLDTRLKKLMNGDFDSIVVAYAGIRRLGREDDVSEIFSTDLMLPAPGQGCLSVQVRQDDEPTADIVSRLNHSLSQRAAAAERAFLETLGGGCRVPIAAYAQEISGKLCLEGLIISPDGQKRVRGSISGETAFGADIGKRLCRRLLAEGGAAILSEPRGTGVGEPP